jgi:uncharacterized protein YjiS (DUF1127 family)
MNGMEWYFMRTAAPVAGAEARPLADKSAVLRVRQVAGALLEGMGRAAEWLSVWQDRNSGRRALDSLNDRTLHDIGLTRADVSRESMKPFWRG